MGEVRIKEDSLQLAAWPVGSASRRDRSLCRASTSSRADCATKWKTCTGTRWFELGRAPLLSPKAARELLAGLLAIGGFELESGTRLVDGT